MGRQGVAAVAGLKRKKGPTHGRAGEDTGSRCSSPCVLQPSAPRGPAPALDSIVSAHSNIERVAG